MKRRIPAMSVIIIAITLMLGIMSLTTISKYGTQEEYPLKAYIIEHNVTYTKMWAEGTCKLDSGKILCLVKRGTQASNPSTDICIQNSTDNGSTWGDLTLIKAHDATYGFLAKELFIAPNGSLIFHYLEWSSRTHSYVCQMHSNDDGITWIDDGRVAGTTTYYGHVNNAIILSDGYTIVVGLSESVSTEYDNSEVIISINNGTSWTRSSQVPRPAGEPSVFEPTVVELSNGTLVMYCRSPGNGYLWKTYSTNKGSTWCKAFNSGIVAPSAPVGLLRYSWSPSIVLMAWDNDTTTRYPLNISVSYDECVTWHNSTLLQNSSLGDVAYPRFMFGTTTDDNMIFVSAWINNGTYADTMGYRFPFSWLNNSEESPPPDPAEFISIEGGVNGTTIYTSNPTFNWTRVNRTARYHLEISTDSAFTSLVVNITDINEINYPTYYFENSTRVSFTIPDALPGHDTYYCCVRAQAKS